MTNVQEHIDSGLYPKDIEDAVRRWDAGEMMWTVEMGGLGPGYEQCIQIGMIEVLRRLIDVELPGPDGNWNDFLDPFLHEVNNDFDLGLSGAQADAIKQLACKFSGKGWLSVEGAEDRMIMVSKHWPGAPKPKEVK